MADLKGASESLTALLGKRATTLEVLAVSAKIAAAVAAALIALAKVANFPPWVVCGHHRRDVFDSFCVVR